MGGTWALRRRGTGSGELEERIRAGNGRNMKSLEERGKIEKGREGKREDIEVLEMGGTGEGKSYREDE